MAQFQHHFSKDMEKRRIHFFQHKTVDCCANSNICYPTFLFIYHYSQVSSKTFLKESFIQRTLLQTPAELPLQLFYLLFALSLLHRLQICFAQPNFLRAIIITQPAIYIASLYLRTHLRDIVFCPSSSRRYLTSIRV